MSAGASPLTHFKVFMSVIFFLMGKSVSGKDTLGRMLLADKNLSLKPVMLCTTRPMREGEKDGREYIFCDEKKLSDYREQGKVVEERVYHTVQGDWYYFTPADEGLIKDLETGRQDYLALGTLEAYISYRDHFGKSGVIPVYVEVDDDIRLIRAVERERRQQHPDYKELCRRFLADEEDFSPDKLKAEGIEKIFYNNGETEECYSKIVEYIDKCRSGGI